MKVVTLVAALFVFATAFIVSVAPARADTYYGTVTHVSSANIKAKDNTGKEVSFLLAPSFDQLFSSDGKTTFQMKDLKPGTPVKIVYHQQLGIRYADKIFIQKH